MLCLCLLGSFWEGWEVCDGSWMSISSLGRSVVSEDMRMVMMKRLEAHVSLRWLLEGLEGPRWDLDEHLSCLAFDCRLTRTNCRLSVLRSREHYSQLFGLHC